MVSKLKVLAPFALVAMTLVSCGSNTDIKSRIDRVKYTEITEDKAKKSYDLLTVIKKQQTNIPRPGQIQSRRLALLNSGEMKTTIEAAIKGSLAYNEIRMNDINLAINTKYDMYWNLDKGYIEFRNDNKSLYIVKEGDKYWNAHSFTVDGNEVKERTELPNEFNFEWFLRQSLINRACFLPGIELGMSGFGFLPDEEFQDESMPSISGLFYSENVDMYQIYDFIGQHAGNGHNLTCTIAAKDENDPETYAFSGNLNANLDLKQLKTNIGAEIPESIRELIERFLGLNLNGTLNFDLFAAWADAYICQQEYIIKAKDLDISGGIDATYFINIKGDMDFYFAEENKTSYEVPEGKIEQILNDYKPVETPKENLW